MYFRLLTILEHSFQTRLQTVIPESRSTVLVYIIIALTCPNCNRNNELGGVVNFGSEKRLGTW